MPSSPPAAPTYARHAHTPPVTPPAVLPAESNARADQLLAAAGDAAVKGNWRLCANNYLAAFTGSSPQWSLRYNCWSGYASVLREGNVQVVPEDRSALRSVADDVAAPALHRVQAHFTIGFVSNSANDVGAARKGYADAIRVADDISPAERQALVTVATAKGYEPLPAGTIVDDLKRYSQDNLRSLGGTRGKEESPGADLDGYVAHKHAPSSAVGAASSADAFDEPVVLTKSAVEYAHTFFEIAMRRRAMESGNALPAEGGLVSVSASGETAIEGAAEALLSSPTHTAEFETVLPLPQPSPRQCDVHSCELLADDIACQRNSSCALALGHLEPMGNQFAHPTGVEEMSAADGGAAHDESSPRAADPRLFWRRYVAGYRPVIVRGGAAASIAEPWDDAFLQRHCRLDDGLAWRALIEKNNRVVQNDRHPLMYDWTFCDFAFNYSRSEFKNMLYVVSPISERGVALPRHLWVPEILRCSELHRTIYEARLWASGGNTTSSLHFDTHDNLMLQLGGTKEVFMWHPRESAHFYSDFHNKFGLSPISADRVDLDRFPLFANSSAHRALMHQGDALYIPDGWWHLIRSHGRNVAIAIEFEPFARDGERHWPADVLARYHWPGLFWAESVRIKYEMRERLGASHYTSLVGNAPIQCDHLARHPMLFAEIANQMGGH